MKNTVSLTSLRETDDVAASRKLPRRDYVLLPLIVVATVVCLFVAAEFATRAIWSAGTRGGECHVADAREGMRNVPNCTMTVKTPETPWITYHYNACGFRSTEGCGPKPAGTRRVALLGTSFAEGTSLPYDQSFAALAEHDLSRMCGAPVEVQNLGVYELPFRKVLNRIGPALALQPDAAVLTVAPFDLEKINLPDVADAPAATVAPEPRSDLMARAKGWLSGSRAVAVAQHYMFENPDIQVPMYLKYGDKADFLRPPFSTAWRERLETFDKVAATVADRFRATGVPVALMLIPQRTQAGLLAAKSLPTGIDPLALDHAMAEIAAKHGMRYIDLASSLKQSANPADYYYPVDNHLNAAGARVVARSMVTALIAGGEPALSACGSH
ncbi:SGNH/GDSL hydrolase family protein [Burkholderia sp. Bp8977]|uniref:SGNH/GDSL hydrolase family protein n=2 Tax=Burkholderia TaxID=32008 RepID=UPI000F559C25|nr:SGNH/GDSL hydrolase family protein [Burkholderia sp. Bp8977]RQR90463.1 SGNH/GDSL hydrolase family protein [Burkholderia sp. Bp9011]RQR99471.1 SGNH/GDSL hydrolase family protein [Burkholderia sp. Bp9010]RQS13458.1 SGNH/GDSL hydrolase family protein [Burkholderia sp. Bp8991]RQS82481.1 SGNH/GDSL hydrolase family protein [Burkholderia sp. Bp8977]